MKPEGLDSAKNYQKKMTMFWTDNSKTYGNWIREQLQSHMKNPVEYTIKKLSPMGKKLRILDIGVGAGFTSVTAAMMGHEVVGIDTCDAMLAEAAKTADMFGVEISLVKCDAHDLHPELGMFDMAIAENTVYNLCYPEKALKSCLALLKPGGRFTMIEFDYSTMDLLVEKHSNDIFDHVVYWRKGSGWDVDSGFDYEPLIKLRNETLKRSWTHPWGVWSLLNAGLTGVRVSHLESESFMDSKPNDDAMNLSLVYEGTKGGEMKRSTCADIPLESLKETMNDLDVHVSSTTAALSQPDRLKIAMALRVGPLTASEVAYVSNLPQNLASYHLKSLRHAGVVNSEKKGRSIIYSITDTESMDIVFSAAKRLRNCSNHGD